MASKSLGVLTLDLVAKTAGFVQGMDKAERKAAEFSRKTKKRVDDATKAMQRLAVVGAAGVTAAFAAVVRATANQEKAIAQLDAVLKSTGGTAGRTSEQLQGMAAALQKTTTFGDEAIIEMQSMLLTFTNIRGEIFDNTVPAILDLSVAMKQDLKTSAIQLGKALNDPIANLSALGRTGIQFSDQQEAVIKSLAETGRIAEAQALILQELNRQFGGSAAAAADTFSGKIDQVKNAFGDLLENPAGLEANKEALQDLIDFLQDPATVAAANDLTQALIDGFASVIEFTRETVNVVKFLRDEVNAFFGDIAANDRVRLDERLAEINDKLNSKLFTTLATQERINELLEEREDIQRRIARIDSFGSERLDFVVPQGRRINRSFGGGAGGGSAEELSKIDVFAQKIKTPEVIEEAIKKQEAFNRLVESLRTEEERLTDQLKERLQVVQDIAYLSEEERDNVRARILESAGIDAPDVGGLAPEVGGALGEILRLDEETERLKEWYTDEIDRYKDYLNQKIISQEEYAAVALEKEQELQDGLASIEQARQQASLVAAEDLFGNLADITRQFAGEQSAAYKVLFAIEKGAAIARSIVAIQSAIAQAAASGPFPANLAAMANVAAATAGLISTIASTTIQGQAHDGLMSVPKTGTYLLEQGERVTTAETSAKLDRKLDNMNDSNIRIVNSFDPADVVGGYMGSAAGERVVMNIVNRNARTIRSLSA